VSALTGLMWAGCSGEFAQSALHPAGPAAAEIAWLWWVMLLAFGGVFALVLALTIVAVVGRPVPPPVSAATGTAGGERSPPFGRTGFIVAGGVLLPIVILTPLYLLSLNTSAALQTSPGVLTVRVIGRMWWWEIRYPDHGVVTANEIYIPAGQRVRLELASADVIHSFWVPRLQGKRDLIPGMNTEFWIEAFEPGVYRGQCAEYCGTQHANMSLLVIALPQREFDAWLAERSAPRSPPATQDQRRGLAIFLSAGCSQCHTIGNTSATGNVGPDLTHVGSRRTLGAAMLPNTRGNLAGWITDPQAIKPGIKMPRSYLRADDLMVLVRYLESLQ
jgi:cytochrome c oxidase subunit 2